MENILTIEINNLKGIKNLKIDLPIHNDIFAIVGENGSGKSTLLQAFAQLIRPQNALFTLQNNDYNHDTYINFEGLEAKDKWCVNKNNKWYNNLKYKNTTQIYEKRTPYEHNNIKVYGMYEGSLFFGTRFSDSKKVDSLITQKKIIPETDLVPADDYIVENLSYILHGDKVHYSTLKRLKNKKLRDNLKLKNLPYFVNSNQGGLISQYRMSSGECLLISLLHFIYNSIVRQSLPTNIPILMLFDEIELALHPSAVSRFLDLLNQLIVKYPHVSVFLTTHASEVIKKIKPNNIYKLENDNGIISYINPCYPAYAIRELYSHDRYDYLILCEDILTKKVVDFVLQKNKLNASKLLYVCPVGGWESVLKLHIELSANNILGSATTIISVLDGDIENECNECGKYKSIKKLFLPIYSIEKCIYDKIFNDNDKQFKKKVNDRFFTLKSINELVSEFTSKYSSKNHDNKNFYNFIKGDLESRNISEMEFIDNLLPILFECVSTIKFENNLSKMINS